jgi:colanic acid biosynthesis protein WcaH
MLACPSLSDAAAVCLFIRTPLRYASRMTTEKFLQIIEATPLVSIDLILCDESGRVLLGYRRNRPAQNTWFVPGGRIRKDERIADARRGIARRELGIDLDTARLVGVFDHLYPDNFLGTPGVSTHYVVLAFSAEISSGTVFLPDEQHGELRWWKVKDLLAAPDVHENTKAYFAGQPDQA